MMEKIAKMGFKPKYVLADAGYDSMKKRRIITSYGAVDVIAPNPRREGKMQFTPSNEWSIIYRKRGDVERVFSRLKEELCLKMVKVREQWRVVVHVVISLITMLSIALVATKMGRKA